MTIQQPPIPAGTRVVVMTGATSGIGARALEHIAAEPTTTVIVGARGTGRTVPAGVETLALDLTSLDAVRKFAAAVIARLDGTPIDTLVLNAGMQVERTDTTTADGYETCFAVNHLAHYLLARLLAPYLADDARVILTTSDTHDRKVTFLAPKSIDIQDLAHPAKPGFGMRAYTASKLCNLLTARSLAEQPRVRERDIEVYAFNPGFTGGTNLGGESSPTQERIMRAVVFPIFKIVGRFKPEYNMGTPERAGEVLAQLTTGALTPPEGHVYVSVLKGEVTYPKPGELALDDQLRDDLWTQSAAMVGLPALTPS
ncbi:SDR family NAD(P)-dependent oxidoreductase [Nocardioides sp. BYT-33-1]|uniref:SDR family NAD(P)-dependent oxidoreductase n=1 Tax=Nocardioides sp. BYT-33-1 TaxID=3416952 RepID=UPI003F53C6FB